MLEPNLNRTRPHRIAWKRALLAHYWRARSVRGLSLVGHLEEEHAPARGALARGVRDGEARIVEGAQDVVVDLGASRAGV